MLLKRMGGGPGLRAKRPTATACLAAVLLTVRSISPCQQQLLSQQQAGGQSAEVQRRQRWRVARWI
jgi:hypothetical protein